MPVAAKSSRRPPAAARTYRSASLERDHAAGREGGGRAYLLTTCARTALGRIIDGLSNAASPRAWTLTGPFGTGKSSFCLYLARLLGPASPSTRAARRRLRADDAALAERLGATLRGDRGLVPILVTGAREPLALALARGLAAAMENCTMRGARRLADEARSVAAGRSASDPVELLERAAAVLAGSPDAAGVLLVLDELGKLLEYAAGRPDRADVYLLQRLAEYAARAATPTFVVGVLHQDFSGYARALSEADRREWEKVRGRYEDVAFEQSADDMLRLIADALAGAAGYDAAAHDPAFATLCRRACDARVLPAGIGTPDRGASLLAACHPLHPCVALLVGPTFKRLGQNERSAFSFLTSAEPHALPAFESARQAGAAYGLADLYQYLVGTFGDALLAGRDGRRWAEALAVEAQQSGLAADELTLLRTVALLGIVGRWYGVTATRPVLELALAPASSAVEVGRALDGLLARSAVVHRRYNDTFGLWEGSDVDVEARVAEARAAVAADGSAIRLLRVGFAPRPIVARRHSFERGTLRHFDVSFTTPTLLGEAVAAFDAADERARADGLVLVVLPDGRGGTVDAAAVAGDAIVRRAGTFVCVPGNAVELESLARELAAVRMVTASSSAELQGDAVARRELAARDADVRRRLERVTAAALMPPRGDDRPQTRWFVLGEPVEAGSSRALNERLSLACDALYADAPAVQNEIVNRRELSTSAAAARGNLLRRLLSHAGEADLGMAAGDPPERSVYRSVVSALRLHQERDGRWAVVAEPDRVRADARRMCAGMRTFFDGAAAAPRGLDELFGLLRRPPFGLRDGVIPIFVVAALVAHEADVAVYEAGAFVPQLTDATLEQLVRDPARFAVRRWRVAGVRATVFDRAARMLGRAAVPGPPAARDLLDAVRPLVRIARRLNAFARHTRTFSPATLAVRDAICAASEPDELLFRHLPEACGIAPFDAEGGPMGERAADAAAFVGRLQAALAELHQGYDSLLRDLSSELASALVASAGAADRAASPERSSPSSGPLARAELAARAAAVERLALSPDAKAFAARLADAGAGDVEWVEQIAALLASKHPSLWHDGDRIRFDARLAQLADAFRSLEGLAIARQSLGATEAAYESIRLSVVGTRSPGAELVVHVRPDELQAVERLESAVAELLDPAGRGDVRRLATAALARLVRRFAAPQDHAVEAT